MVGIARSFGDLLILFCVFSLPQLIPIILVECDDFVPFDEEMLVNLGDIWNDSETHILGLYGIYLDMVKDAYRHLKAFHVAIPFPRFGSAAEKHSVIKQVVTSCKVPMLHGAISGGAIVGDHRDVSQARVNILGHSGDPESLCICET